MSITPVTTWADGLAGCLVRLRRLTSTLGGRRDAGPKSCKDFACQAEAQAYFEARGGNAQHNVDNLDHNHNGIACEVYPYERSPTGPWTRFGPGASRALLPGMFAALGWVAGRQQRRA